MAELSIKTLRIFDAPTQKDNSFNLSKSWILLDEYNYDIDFSVEIFNNNYSIDLYSEDSASASYTYPIQIILDSGEWTQGTVSGGQPESTYTNRIRTEKLSAEPSTTYYLNAKISSGTPNVSLQCWNGSSYILDGSWNYNSMPQSFTTPSSATDMLFVLRKQDNSNITVDDLISVDLYKVTNETTSIDSDNKVYMISKTIDKTYQKDS